ncbi:hypothetical protein CMO88_03250 [Candidatus Woesearchaeota archaeon]|nr:hypothetical protein [Candidatus Woesearchaeota archaeon]|tara:strand:+ start:9411 stop:10331 length:921 start_codon:yes stop_codon:yes gene_type:complete
MTNKRIFSSPRMGIYTDLVKDFFTELGINYVLPPPITQKTIKLGVRHSSDMICFPFKVTLGSHIEALEAGATDLLMFDSAGTCRYTNYHFTQKQILEDLGYKFKMHVISAKTIFPFLKSTGCNRLKALMIARKHWKKIKEVERIHYGNPEKAEIKVVLVGEIFTIHENKINYDIIKKLEKMGVGVKVSLLLSDFIKHIIPFSKDEYTPFKKEAKEYLSSDIAGHGKHTLWDTIDHCKQGYDGVIHLLPLSCAPECLIEMLIDRVCRKYDVPLYSFPIDENQFEVGFDTRIETFVSLLKRRKKRRVS